MNPLFTHSSKRTLVETDINPEVGIGLAASLIL
jgi:hypothetical protein